MRKEIELVEVVLSLLEHVLSNLVNTSERLQIVLLTVDSDFLKNVDSHCVGDDLRVHEGYKEGKTE